MTNNNNVMQSINKVLMFAIVLTAAILFAFIACQVANGNAESFDDGAFGFIAPFSGSRFVNIMEGVTFFGSTAFLLPAYIVIIITCCLRKEFFNAAMIAAISAIGTLMVTGLKLLFHRPRPLHPLITGVTDFSFPSGHAFSGFIFCSVLVWLLGVSVLKKPVKIGINSLLFLLAFSIGLSRIVLRVHHATDVMASYCLALIWVLLFLWVFHRYKKNKRNAMRFAEG